MKTDKKQSYYNKVLESQVSKNRYDAQDIETVIDPDIDICLEQNGLIKRDSLGFVVNNKPVFDVSISIDFEQDTDYWFSLMSKPYHKMTLADITEICREVINKGKKCGIIYCYRNLINSKKYIGQTIDPYSRHSTHVSSSKENTNRLDKKLPLHCAIRKHGLENFEYHVIGLVVSKDATSFRETLDKMERRYIKMFKTDNPSYGYNVLNGGVGGTRNGTTMTVKVLQYSKYGEYITSYTSISEAVRMTGIKGIPSAIHKRYYLSGGYVFVPEDHQYPTEIFEKFKNRRVYQYSVDGDYLAEYESTGYAAKAVNGDASRIDLCAKPPCINIAYGYRWSKEKVDKLQSEAACLPVSICQYDKNGYFVAQHKSLVDAAKSVGLKYGSWIYDSLKFPTRSPGGYYWRYEKCDKIDIPKRVWKKRACKPIVAILEDGTTLNFESAKEAAKHFNVSETTVNTSARQDGKLMQCGLRFKNK